MRIGMMADIYKPHISGVTNAIELTKAVLEANGHEVFIFTFGEHQPEDEAEGVIRSSGIPIPIREPTIQLNFRYSERAQQQLESMDLVHVHHPFLSGRLALRYAKPAGIPIVFTNHTRYDLYARAYLPMLPDQIGTGFLQTYLPAFCHEVDAVIAPSEGLKGVLRDLEVEADITVIPNGVDLAPFQQVEDPISLEELGFEPDNVILVYSGRLGPEKNLMFLMRAFAGVHQAYDRVRLLVIGRGSELDNMMDFAKRSGIHDVVKFTGFVPYEQIPRYLAAADVFVTASVTEVHPLSVIEAIAAGLPVVGIRSPGVGDVVEHNRTGLLADEELASYASMLSRIVASPSDRADFSEQAAIAASRYDINRTTEMLANLYERLVSTPVHTNHSPLSRLWRRLKELV